MSGIYLLSALDALKDEKTSTFGAPYGQFFPASADSATSWAARSTAVKSNRSLKEYATVCVTARNERHTHFKNSNLALVANLNHSNE